MEKVLMCRICLAENVRMCVVVNRNLHELYEKLTDIPFVTEDIRPILACYFCCAKLKQCYRLLRQCLEAEELFAQRMNGDYELNPVINQYRLQLFSGFIKSPIVHVCVDDECETGSTIKEELPAVCEGVDVVIEPKEEHQSDDLEPENLDSSCLDVADISPHHSESDLEDGEPLMEFKTEVEGEEVSKKRRRVKVTKNLEPENLDRSYPDVADISPHHSESDLEDDEPLMEFKTGVEGEEVSKKRQRVKDTKKHEVDFEALSLLDDEQIRVLTPAIGPQAKFKRAHLKWNASNLNSDSLTTLLEKTPDGLQLLKERHQPLGEHNRKVLAREIATHILRANPKDPVTAETYMTWIKEIKRVFPKENSGIYYTKSNGPLGRAQGRLFHAITNLKAKYRRNKVFEPRARRSLEKRLSPKPSTSSSSKWCTAVTHFDDLIAADNDDDTNQETQEMIEWLKSNAHDYSSCAGKWVQTNKERLKRISSNDNELYLQEFPCLRRSWGYTLLIADFHAWYPGNETSFNDKFPLLKIKLLAAFDKMSRKNTYLVELKQLACDPDPETSNLAVLLLIPHLLGPTYIKKKKRSAVELRENFILHIEEEQELQEQQRTRQEKYLDLGLTLQPYIIVVGPLKKISARYVIVGNIVYKMPNIIKAVDTCFKIIWALNLEYPIECLPVWQFMQHTIYTFPDQAVPKDKVPASVLGLISDCGISII